MAATMKSEIANRPTHGNLMEAIRDLNLDLLTDMPRAAKVGHKKSRLGCQRCKLRRVKCDEQKPICGSCNRHGAECVYVEIPRPIVTADDSNDSASRRRSRLSNRARKSPSPSDDMFPATLMDSDSVEVSETRARRMMELRLTQNFLTSVLYPSPDIGPDASDFTGTFQQHYLDLCLRFDNVLYASHALSATQILGSGNGDSSIFSARQNYYVLALREQRRQCARMSDENAEAVCMCSVMISQMSFAMMRERDLTEYSPPMEWLRMGRGANAVLWKAINSMTSGSSPWYKPYAEIFQNAAVEWRHREHFDEPFQTLWNAVQEAQPNAVDQAAYCQALHLVNKLQNAVDAGKRIFILERRVQAFSMVLSPRMAALAEDKDELALIILAHYFGVTIQLESSFWWMRNLLPELQGTTQCISMREIHAINSYLPPDSRSLMAWPLEQALVYATTPML